MLNKTTLLSCVFAIAGALSVSASKSWHITTDAGDKMPVSQIDYLLSADGADGFGIVLKEKGLTYTGVTSCSFEYCEEAGVESIETDTEIIAGPYNGIITLSRLKAGATIAVYSIDGKQMLSETASPSGTCAVDVSSLAKGIYILRTENSFVKFIKD